MFNIWVCLTRMVNAVKMNAVTNIAIGSSTKCTLLEIRHLKTAVKN